MANSQEINAASPDAAREILWRACGSTRWVDRMMQRRPFGNGARLLSAARIEWFGLSESDWLEAFSQHPRIGDRAALEARFPKTHDLSGCVTRLHIRLRIPTSRSIHACGRAW